MARDIDRKLRATATALGLVTRKDLAAAFRQANAATSFDIERAHKWLQGRSSPRDARLYQDWVRVLDIDQSAEWIANCEFDAFLDAVVARYNLKRETLYRQEVSAPEAHSNLAGVYICYSNSWSPYFRGHIIRGALTISDGPTAAAQHATYSEVLPTGPLQVSGTLSAGKRAMHMMLREPTGDAQFMFCLFPPTAPVRVLGGLMCGTTLIGPDSSPSVTRIAMIRLPAPSGLLFESQAYIPQQGSLAQDLAHFGLPVSSPHLVDQRLAEFLSCGDGNGLDQPSTASYRAIVELFDRAWLKSLGD